MVFTSYVFVIFLLAMLACHRLLPWRWAKWSLVVGSFVFYGYAKWSYIFLLLFSTCLDYFIGLALQHTEKKGPRKVLVLASIITNLGFLGFFKYANFLIDQVNLGLAAFGLPDAAFAPVDVVLPVGISFYTFQTMAYSIDIYRGKLTAERNFASFALYVSFFPQLVAGPIERPDHMLPQFRKKLLPTAEDFHYGLERIFWGLVKKLVFADRFGLMVEPIYAAPLNELTGPMIWLGTICFSLQVYLDFSAYTDIAIGTARLFGIRLMENFNWPFLAPNIAQVWRRWHISLSTWLRDYLYFPLGGSKKGRIRTLFNVLFVMFIAGLWHGAAWNFVGWGLFLGCSMIIHQGLRMLFNMRRDTPMLPGKTGYVLSILLTFITFNLSLVVFRAPNVPKSFQMMYMMFTNAGNAQALLHGTPLVFTLLCVFVLILHVIRGRGDIVPRNWNWYNLPWVRGLRLALMFLLFTFLGVSTEQTFIYFQF